jgi:hypothetical protein
MSGDKVILTSISTPSFQALYEEQHLPLGLGSSWIITRPSAVSRMDLANRLLRVTEVSCSSFYPTNRTNLHCERDQ